MQGVLIKRGDRRVFSVVDGDDAILPLSFDDRDSAQLLTFGNITQASLEPTWLVGEIIDPKCYIGAMKPGGGKTHKACAILCLKGGIPPMLVTKTAGGEFFYLITDANGGPIVTPLLPFVGDRIKVRAKVDIYGDLAVAKLDPKTIERQ